MKFSATVELKILGGVLMMLSVPTDSVLNHHTCPCPGGGMVTCEPHQSASCIRERNGQILGQCRTVPMYRDPPTVRKYLGELLGRPLDVDEFRRGKLDLSGKYGVWSGEGTTIVFGINMIFAEEGYNDDPSAPPQRPCQICVTTLDSGRKCASVDDALSDQRFNEVVRQLCVGRECTGVVTQGRCPTSLN